MIELTKLHELLETREKDLEALTDDQLRTLLGVFRYLTRLLERKINQRAHLQ